MSRSIWGVASTYGPCIITLRLLCPLGRPFIVENMNKHVLYKIQWEYHPEKGLVVFWALSKAGEISPSTPGLDMVLECERTKIQIYF